MTQQRSAAPNIHKETEQIWDALAKVFSNWKWVRPQSDFFFSGISSRMMASRLRKLESSKLAKPYFDLTRECTLWQIEYLNARARVNVDMAAQAARLTIIINVTSVIAIVVLLNQIFPGWIGNIILSGETLEERSILEAGFLSMLIAFIVFTPLVLLYCTGGVVMARELKYLLELSLSRRRLSEANDELSEDDIEEWMNQSLLKDI